MHKKIKIKGKEFNFVLDIRDYGFTLWDESEYRWILDASTIGNDGTFRSGWEDGVHEELNIKLEKEDWSGRVEFKLKKVKNAKV